MYGILRFNALIVGNRNNSIYLFRRNELVSKQIKLLDI